MSNKAADLFDAIDGTWPAARIFAHGPWTLREGQGGGSRVSAATATAPVGPEDLAGAEAAMRDLGQSPLFMIRPGDEALDQMLESRGYTIRDPVILYACPVARLTGIPLPRLTVFTIWEPLAISREIWAAGGIGIERVAVMERARGPKTTLLLRHREKPGGTAYVAIHDGMAMVHAVEILPHQRKQGLAGWVMRAAAFWAAEHGAENLSVMCTRANTGANALYSSLGMPVVGQYHYRHPPSEKDTK